MMRMRRKVPFEGLAIQFGIAVGTAHQYYKDVLNVFSKTLAPRLLDPPDAHALTGWTDKDIKVNLPGAMFIVDLTAFRLKSQENTAMGRILYSSYHHQSEAAAVFGMVALDEGFYYFAWR